MGLSATIKQLDRGAAALGVLVFKEATTVPQGGAQSDLFIIAGGKILLTSIIGQVVVAITATGGNATRLVHTPTTGLETLTPLCADLDTNSGDVGLKDAIWTITGDVTDLLISDEKAGVDDPSMLTNLLILQPGVIALECDDADAAGSVKWSMQYVALDKNTKVKRVF